ncbi:MAG: flagellar hook assembly protein FlgD [Acidimicrobiales bacterium]
MSDISAVGTTTPVAPTSDGFSSTALQGIDKEMFLKLLVAQMQYQNPMNPVDSTEFLNQAAQYASVEQLENMATQQAEMRSLQMITVATGMVGNEVTAIDPATGEPMTGVVTSVQFDGAEPLLVIGNTVVPVTSVIEMRGPAGEADQVAPDATEGTTTAGDPDDQPAESDVETEVVV